MFFLLVLHVLVVYYQGILCVSEKYKSHMCFSFQVFITENAL